MLQYTLVIYVLLDKFVFSLVSSMFVYKDNKLASSPVSFFSLFLYAWIFFSCHNRSRCKTETHKMMFDHQQRTTSRISMIDGHNRSSCLIDANNLIAFHRHAFISCRIDHQNEHGQNHSSLFSLRLFAYAIYVQYIQIAYNNTVRKTHEEFFPLHARCTSINIRPKKRNGMLVDISFALLLSFPSSLFFFSISVRLNIDDSSASERGSYQWPPTLRYQWRQAREMREREREKKEDDVNIMARPRIFANFGDISALVRPTNARFFL